MITIEDCNVICSSIPMGARILTTCLADRYHRSEAFASFCSLFMKGKSPANPDPTLARSAHRQIFATLAGLSGAQGLVESIQVSYVVVSTHLRELGTVRPWTSFRADDIFTVVVLMDNSCRGYVCFEDFIKLVDIILLAMRKYETSGYHNADYLNDCVHGAFMAAFDLVRRNSVISEGAGIDTALEKKLVQFASTSRGAGKSPLSTFCHMGCRNQWQFGPQDLFSLLMKLAPNQHAHSPVNRRSPRRPDDREVVDTMDIEELRWKNPTRSSPDVSPNQRPLTRSPAKSPIRLQLQARSLPEQGIVQDNGARDGVEVGGENVIENLETLQKEMAHLTSMIASQNAEGTLTANTALWDEVQALGQRIQSIQTNPNISPKNRVYSANGSKQSKMARNPGNGKLNGTTANYNSPNHAMRSRAAQDGDNAADNNSSEPLNIRQLSQQGPLTPLQEQQSQSSAQAQSPDSVNNCSVTSTSSCLGHRVLKAKTASQLLNRSKSAERARRPSVNTDQVWKDSPRAADLFGSSGISSINGSPNETVQSTQRLAPPTGPGLYIRTWHEDLDARFDVNERIIGTVDLLFQDQCAKTLPAAPSTRSRSRSASAQHSKRRSGAATSTASAGASIKTTPGASNDHSKTGYGTLGDSSSAKSVLDESLAPGISLSELDSSRDNVQDVSKRLFRSASNIEPGGANFGGSGRPLMKPRSSVNGAGSRPNSAGRTRPIVASGGLDRSINNSVNLSIFRASSISRSANTNVFDPKTLKWKPSYLENKYNERFQNSADLILHSKLNSVFYGNDDGY